VGAVVCGYDRKLNYKKLNYAFQCLTTLPGCMFIAPNLDSTLPASNNRYFLASGACSAPLITATGRKPINLGKPETYILDLLVEEHKLDRKRTIMVGDRLDTDIMLGVNGDISTMLVLTGDTVLLKVNIGQGVDTKESLEDEKNEIHPTFYIPSVGDIVPLYTQATN
jgi:HAD superfamily hydrolase (TIGR01450 family)